MQVTFAQWVNTGSEFFSDASHACYRLTMATQPELNHGLKINEDVNYLLPTNNQYHVSCIPANAQIDESVGYVPIICFQVKP